MALPTIVTYEGPEQDVLWREVFSGLPLHSPRNAWHEVANANSPGIQDVPLNFEHTVIGASRLGFFYPTEYETLAVSCRNHYRNPAMDARTFGMGVTIVWMNELAHSLARSGQINTSKIADRLYHQLRNWAFNMEGLNHTDLFDFLD